MADTFLEISALLVKSDFTDYTMWTDNGRVIIEIENEQGVKLKVTVTEYDLNTGLISFSTAINGAESKDRIEYQSCFASILKRELELFDAE